MLLQEFRGLEPDARQITLGLHKVWTWQTVVPAFTFTSVVLFHAENRAIEVKARQGYSDEIAAALLDFLARWDGFDADARTIAVLPWRKSSTQFDRAVVAPPLVAHCFRHQSDILERACFWAFPCYSGEFKSGQDESEFEATIRRAGEVHIVEWDRNPAPHMKFQLLDPWPGGMLAKRKKPLQLPFRILAKYIWELPVETVRVRLQDILGRDLVVTHQAKGLVFSGEMLSKPERIEKQKDANRRLLSFLRGGDF